MNNSNNTWIIGGAVVVAGLLIAAGIFFGDSGTTNSEGGDLAVAAAETANIDMDEFRSCLSSDQFQDVVRADATDANANGGTGTPYNVLVLADPLSSEGQNQITNLSSSIKISADGKRLAISGAVPYASMKQVIDALLNDPQTDEAAASSSEFAIAPVDDEDHIRGNQNAEVVIVEYSDLRCPYCAQFHQTMKQVVDTYEADQVAWVYRHLPIPQLHPQAPRLAQGAECAASLGGDDAFWSYTDYIFSQNESV